MHRSPDSTPSLDQVHQHLDHLPVQFQAAQLHLHISHPLLLYLLIHILSGVIANQGLNCLLYRLGCVLSSSFSFSPRNGYMLHISLKSLGTVSPAGLSLPNCRQAAAQPPRPRCRPTAVVQQPSHHQAKLPPQPARTTRSALIRVLRVVFLHSARVR
jgi:hypothetical protein